MGIYKKYSEEKGKWYWEGAFGIKYFDTEEECDNASSDIWELHMATLNAFKTVTNMLVGLRYR